MKVPSKFTIAIHTLLFIYKFDGEIKTTSKNIAGSVGVNSVIIRQVLSDLKNADIITVKSGTGGAKICKDLKKISLFDVYNAVIPEDDSLFSFHSNPQPACPVGKNIHGVLDTILNETKVAFDTCLKKYSIFDLTKNLDKLTDKN